MKKLLSILIVLAVCVVSSMAQTANVTFVHIDGQGNPQTNCRAILTPKQPFVGYNGNFLTAKPLYLITDANGSVVFSNIVSGYQYQEVLQTSYSSTTNIVGLPPGLTGNVNGLTYAGTNTGPYFAYFFPTNFFAAGSGVTFSTNGLTITISASGGSGTDANALHATNNLSDLTSESTARANLGLGTAATSAASTFQPASSVLTNLGGGLLPNGTTISNAAGNTATLTIAGSSGTGGTSQTIVSTPLGLTLGNLSTGTIQGTTISGTFTGNGSGLTNLTTLWTNFCLVSKLGNDTTGARNGLLTPFLTIGQAKTNAQSGDTIFVLPGVYAENNLLKKGVAYQFWPGVTISNNPTGNNTNGWGIFDDRAPGAGQGTYYVYGYPNLWYSTGTISNALTVDTGSFFQASWDPDGNFAGDVWTMGSTNDVGCIVVTNGSSVIAKLGDIYYENFAPNSVYPYYAGIALANNSYSDIEYGRVIDTPGTKIVNGSIDVQSSQPYVLTAYTNANGYGWLQSQGRGVVWQNGQGTNTGEAHVHSRFLDVFPGYGLWCNEVGVLTNESHFVWTCDYMAGNTYISGPTNSYGTNMIMWMNVPIYLCPGALGTVESLGVFKLYYQGGEKILNNAGGPAFSISGLAWINCQKATVGGGGPWVNIATSVNNQVPALAYVSIDQYDDVGGTPVGFVNNGGELHIQGGYAKLMDGLGILHGSGTTYVDGGFRMDCTAGTHTNDWPVLTTASGLHLGDTILTAGSTILNSLYATNAQTVSIDNPAASGNKGVCANVTLTGTNAAFLVSAATANLGTITVTNTATVGSLVIGNITNTASGALIQTNFISGKLYTNIYGRPILVSANATLTLAAVSGDAELALLASSYLTNIVFELTTATLGSGGSGGVISMVVPASQTYTFTNLSTGAGNSAVATGGQILVY